jgi:hypothetical protein
MCEKNVKGPVGPEHGIIEFLKKEYLLPNMEKETMEDPYE